MNGKLPMAQAVWLLPLMLFVRFQAYATTISSCRLLLSAGVEKPQDFWARNKSAMAEDLAPVLRWIHLRQVMLAWS